MNANFQNCLVYVQKTWPDEDHDMHMLRAYSIYQFTGTFFSEILPAILEKHFAYSLN